MASEPFLATTQRFTLYPIEHEDIFNAYKTQLACMWVANEIDYSKDRMQFDALNGDEQHFLKCILSFFAASDSVVSLNILENFCAQIPVLEAQVCYTYQAMMENIHSEAYSMMIDTYVSDPLEKEQLLRDVSLKVSVQRKMDWANRYRHADVSVATRVVAYVIVEGLYFSSAFAGIFWFKQRNVLPALTKSNTLIARDEGQHVAFGALLYSKLTATRLPTQAVVDMMRDAVAVEHAFVRETIVGKHLGMNADLMCQYVEFVADGLLVMLGYDKVWNSTNPFPYMDLLGMDGRDNFFEGVPTQYQRGAVLNQGLRLELTDDF